VALGGHPLDGHVVEDEDPVVMARAALRRRAERRVDAGQLALRLEGDPAVFPGFEGEVPMVGRGERRGEDDRGDDEGMTQARASRRASRPRTG